MDNRTATIRADWLLLLAAVIWGFAFVAQRVGMEHLGPHTFNGLRFLLGGLALSPLIIYRPAQKPQISGGLPGPLAVRPILWGGGLAGLVLFVAAAFQQAGLVYTTAGKAGFITGLYVIFVPLFGLTLGQKLTRWQGLGAMLALIGLYLLSVTDEFSLAWGDLLELIGAIFWALHFLTLGWLSPRIDPLRLARSQFLWCAALSLVVGLIFEPISRAGLVGALPAIAYSGLMSVGVAYTLQALAQRHAPPTHAAIILSLEAAFAALSGWIFLGEVLTTRALIGCALMLAGMLAAQIRQRQ